MTMTFACDEKRENNWNGYNRMDFDCSCTVYKSVSNESTDNSVIRLIMDTTNAEDHTGVSSTDFGIVRVGSVEIGMPEQMKRRSRRKYDE